MASLYSPNSFSFAPEQLRQVINPLSWLTSGTGQIGLFNVYQTATSKPEVEAEIVKNVAGYGRQLGRITDLLQVMLREPDRGKWSASDEAVASDFSKLAERIAIVKANHLAPTDENIRKLIDGINCVRDVNPAEYERIRGEVRAKLFPEIGAVAPTNRARSRGKKK